MKTVCLRKSQQLILNLHKSKILLINSGVQPIPYKLMDGKKSIVFIFFMTVQTSTVVQEVPEHKQR
ncbi:Uncharacterised protein [Vibrio cholerae]|nr:Uncharacterised protein [Vibrio cholerae]